MKEIAFIKEKGDHILVHKGKELSVYIWGLSFELPEQGLFLPDRRSGKLEKAIHEDIQINKLKLSDYLPHQWAKNGEECEGHKFWTHCQTEHRNWCPSALSLMCPPISNGYYGTMKKTIWDSWIWRVKSGAKRLIHHGIKLWLIHF